MIRISTRTTTDVEQKKHICLYCLYYFVIFLFLQQNTFISHTNARETSKSHMFPIRVHFHRIAHAHTHTHINKQKHVCICEMMHRRRSS